MIWTVDFMDLFYQIYSKYIEVIDEMEIVKLENKRLNDTMDSILKVSPC